jgi:gluconokinase
LNAPPISAYQETCGLIYFARMLDRIRKHARGQLRPDFHENLGGGFDAMMTDYLRIDYATLRERVLGGCSDEEMLDWCFETGRRLNEQDILIWNDFLRKRGWNDAGTAILVSRKQEAGLAHRDDIQTMLHFFEVDEGRAPVHKP